MGADITETSGQQFYSHGIQVDASILEDATKDVDSTAVIYAGRPVYLTSAAAVKQVATDIAVYGLAKSDKNSYVDDTANSYGAYGSGKMAVVCKGRVTLRPNYYLDPVTSVVTTVHVWDTTKTYLPMQALYVTAGNLITNVTATSNTKFGICLKPPSVTDLTMQAIIDCPTV